MVSEELHKKLSEAQKKRFGTDPEGLRVLSEEQRRERTSEETRRKIGDAKRGQLVTEETRKKMSVSHKKRWGVDPNTPTGREIACEILKKHHETLKEDPERLSTEFMQKLIGIDCDKL